MAADTAPGSQPAAAPVDRTDRSPDAPAAVTQHAEDRSPGGRRNLTLAVVCLAPFVTQLATFALSPFLPFVAADLGASVSLLGQIPALALFTAAVLGLVVGPLADRAGARLGHRAHDA